jgi:tetratricopeptide (TPR) repeat protein
LSILLAFAAPVYPQFESVGTLQFPTSGSPEAQKHFLRGVAILHSFGWKQAIAEFQAAQRLQPDFAMSYWGETLCYNHPLQAEQDAESPRKVLARLGADARVRLAKAPTEREKDFLRAVELLWGEGDYRARRVRHMEAMARLYETYPQDDEVAAFYAVSLLSGARALNDDSFRFEMRAGAIAQGIFARNPKHPGAPHYMIHAFDDPVHAPLSLIAARAYAGIAPAVSHARHMPTHIFIQHGMWREVATQNDSAYEAASELWREGDSVGDMMHSLDWGQYGYLQLGDYARARRHIDLIQQVVDKSKAARARSALTLAKARYIVETEEWNVSTVADDASAETLLAVGMSAAKTGDLATAEQAEARLKALVDKRAPTTGGGAGHESHAPQPAGGVAVESGKSEAVMYREVAAMVRSAKGAKDDAVRLLVEATGIEDSMRPPNGAADPIKPSHELLGELLLEVDRAADAVKPLETSQLRMPNRPRTLLGLARAYAKTGQRAKAAEHYRKLADIWKDRSSLPGLQEAKRFLSSTEP